MKKKKLTFISTSSHGYLIISHKLLNEARAKGFAPTQFSLYNKNRVLLEEDVDADKFLALMFPPDTLDLTVKYQENINRNLYEWFFPGE